MVNVKLNRTSCKSLPYLVHKTSAAADSKSFFRFHSKRVILANDWLFLHVIKICTQLSTSAMEFVYNHGITRNTRIIQITDKLHGDLLGNGKKFIAVDNIKIMKKISRMLDTYRCNSVPGLSSMLIVKKLAGTLVRFVSAKEIVAVCVHPPSLFR